MLTLQLPERPGGFNPTDARTRKPAGPGRHRIGVLCAMGSNMRIKFTKANIEALEPPPKGEIFAWCEDKPGWGVRVLASGRKSWIVQFRDASGKSKRHTIGDLRIVPLTLAEQRASELLAHAKLGKDLLTEEQAARERRKVDAERSVGRIVRDYLSEPEVKRRRSFAEVKRYLEAHWQKVHGESAETVSRHELTPELRRIASERGEVAANRARWALSLEELGAVWRTAPEVNPSFGSIIRLLVLTGCRKSEIADLRWSEVDLDDAVIRLPGSRTKNKRPHVVPLAPAAVSILKAVQHINPTLVFPGVGSWSRPKEKLDPKLALPQWVIHDVRRSVATGLREHLGADAHLVELIINHVSGSRAGVAGIYDRSERLAERRRALERWADLVLRAAGEPVGDAKVVNLR